MYYFCQVHWQKQYLPHTLGSISPNRGHFPLRDLLQNLEVRLKKDRSHTVLGMTYYFSTKPSPTTDSWKPKKRWQTCLWGNLILVLTNKSQDSETVSYHDYLTMITRDAYRYKAKWIQLFVIGCSSPFCKSKNSFSCCPLVFKILITNTASEVSSVFISSNTASEVSSIHSIQNQSTFSTEKRKRHIKT